MRQNDKKYRRRLDTMMVLGLGYCFIGFWSVIRVIMMFAFNGAYYWASVVSAANLEQESETFLRIVYVIIVITIMLFSGGDTLLRVFIGLGARRDAAGKRSNAYIGWLIVVIVFDIISIFAGASSFQVEESFNFIDFIGTFLMNTMTLVISFDLLTASLYVRKYRKSLKSGESAAPTAKKESEVE